jgi:hypothetical protein
MRPAPTYPIIILYPPNDKWFGGLSQGPRFGRAVPAALAACSTLWFDSPGSRCYLFRRFYVGTHRWP